MYLRKVVSCIPELRNLVLGKDDVMLGKEYLATYSYSLFYNSEYTPYNISRAGAS